MVIGHSSHFPCDNNLEERKYEYDDSSAENEEEKYQESNEHEHESEDKSYRILCILLSNDSAEILVSDPNY